MNNFNLCNLCVKPSEDKCSLYRKDPSKIVYDCGRFVPDNGKTDYIKAAQTVMENALKGAQ